MATLMVTLDELKKFVKNEFKLNFDDIQKLTYAEYHELYQKAMEREEIEATYHGDELDYRPLILAAAFVDYLHG